MSNDSDDSAVKPTIIDLDPDQVIVEGESKPADTLKSKSSIRFLLWSMSALAAAAIGGGWFYRDVLSTYFPSDQLKQTEARAVRLETDNKALHDEVARLGKLADSLSNSFNALENKTTTSAATADAALNSAHDNEARISALDNGLNETKKAVADLSGKIGSAAPVSGGPVDGAALAALSARIDGLEKDVASLKSLQGSGATDTAVLSQSLADLKAKIASGVGYGPELERIQRLAPAAPGLDVLALNAEQGLPDAKGLAGELTALADTLPKPDAAAADDGGTYLSNAWKAFSSVVRVRNIGDADWPTVARSAATLSGQGDVRQAIDQLNSVEGTKPAGLVQWIDRAESRLKLDAAANAVSEAVMRVIAAKG